MESPSVRSGWHGQTSRQSLLDLCLAVSEAPSPTAKPTKGADSTLAWPCHPPLVASLLVCTGKLRAGHG